MAGFQLIRRVTTPLLLQICELFVVQLRLLDCLLVLIISYRVEFIKEVLVREF